MKKQDIKTIHEMLQQGKNTTEISLVLGIPSSTIRAHIRRHPELYGGKACRKIRRRYLKYNNISARQYRLLSCRCYQ